jgi:hypothetical protein
MRERAHLAGGWLTAGPDGEHFRVTAFIPYGTLQATTGDDAADDAATDTFGEISGAEVQPTLAATSVSRQAGAAREADNCG